MENLDTEMRDLLVRAYREIKRHRLSRIHFVWQGRTEADQLEWEIAQLLSRIVDAEAQRTA